MNKTLLKKCEINYNRLVRLGLDLDGGQITNETVDNQPFMPLSVTLLGYRAGPMPSYDIALSHRYKQNGDLMADPDMEIRVYPTHRLVEALTFQQDSLQIYQRVYPEPGKFYPKLQKDLNMFLHQWLRNIEEQGFEFRQQSVASTETD